MRELQIREVKWLAQGHTAYRVRIWSQVYPKPMFSPQSLHSPRFPNVVFTQFYTSSPASFGFGISLSQARVLANGFLTGSHAGFYGQALSQLQATRYMSHWPHPSCSQGGDILGMWLTFYQKGKSSLKTSLVQEQNTSQVFASSPDWGSFCRSEKAGGGGLWGCFHLGSAKNQTLILSLCLHASA